MDLTRAQSFSSPIDIEPELHFPEPTESGAIDAIVPALSADRALDAIGAEASRLKAPEE